MNRDGEINQRIGAALRAARLARGVTQADLAHLLDIDRTLVSHYERGTRTLPATALLQTFAFLEQPLAILDDRAAQTSAPLPPEIARIVAMLHAHPELIPTVDDVLTTYLDQT